jgi:hypothetical protein
MGFCWCGDLLFLRELALRRPDRSHGIRERDPEISSAVAFGEFARWGDEAVFYEEFLGFAALDYAIDVLADLEHFRLVVRGAWLRFNRFWHDKNQA